MDKDKARKVIASLERQKQSSGQRDVRKEQQERDKSVGRPNHKAT